MLLGIGTEGQNCGGGGLQYYGVARGGGEFVIYWLELELRGLGQTL